MLILSTKQRFPKREKKNPWKTDTLLTPKARGSFLRGQLESIHGSLIRSNPHVPRFSAWLWDSILKCMTTEACYRKLGLKCSSHLGKHDQGRDPPDIYWLTSDAAFPFCLRDETWWLLQTKRSIPDGTPYNELQIPAILGMGSGWGNPRTAAGPFHIPWKKMWLVLPSHKPRFDLPNSTTQGF